ncbi:hypothetical protein K488DRAFT_51948 [Vararia minispora EC-137]|uniref:Uncharacterized protein n=1 Tax=Vararia minispora EC-137 TaxID=1314806 RepID=A0ACB8QIS0_9AGAM|nr:hypothetical protein K488DRAFT_51948 [Vararia minispora EC-137]
MSSQDTSSQPRRSQRDRKQAKQFVSGPSLKRKRSEDTDEEALTPISEGENEQSDDEAPEDGEEYSAPRRSTSIRGGAKRGRPKGRANTTTTTRPRPPKPSAPRPSGSTRRGKATRNGADAPGPVAAGKETKIATDNSLFNAIMNPAAALQSTVEDFLDSLVTSENAALAELVNCILRACGCNESVDEHEAVDYDGIVDKLDNITEVLKMDDSPVYPLTSKLAVFKKFRKSLLEFLERLVASAAETGALYSTELMETLRQWAAAMSSSQLRSFRHTATVVALQVETSLCDVAAAVEKEIEVLVRQVEGEKKRSKAGGNAKGKTALTALQKELNQKLDDVRERRSNLEDTLKDLTDGVFVNRYRDLDPSIRAECIHGLGQWFKKFPSHFLDGNYLRYVGWVLSDANNPVRLESVRALANIYQNTEYISALQNFTERFKPRLLQMAAGDTDLGVRIAVAGVLSAIDRHGLLDDTQREELCLLVFDEEARVRRAVGGFVRGVWAELVEERLVGRRASDAEKRRAGVKALGTLLVRLSRALDKKSGGGVDEEDTADELAHDGAAKPSRVREVMALSSGTERGRIGVAVEALWDEVDPVKDWEVLLEVLLLDHSSEDEGSQETRQRRSKGKKSQKDATVDDAWRLEEIEETVLLEVFVAALRQAKALAANNKKVEEETVTSEITRALIKGIPRLFAKHQADEKRIGIVLLIPPLMNIELYLEMRMITAYENLWDDVAKQLLSHSSQTVVSNAVATVRHMMDATSLSNTNSTKIAELEDELVTSLRDIVAGREELEITTFNEDEVLKLGAVCSRVAALTATRDMSIWMEEDEGGKQSSAWDIIAALAERGKLGYKEEKQMVQQCIEVLNLHILWKARHLPNEPGESQARNSFIEQRQILLDKLVDFSLGTTSNTVDGVRRVAFQNLMNLHILFHPSPNTPSALSHLSLTLDDEVQDRCAAFVQSEIERYADELEELAGVGAEDEDEAPSGSQSSDEETQTIRKRRRPKTNGTTKTNGTVQLSTGSNTTRSQLEREYVFMGVISTFLRAIRVHAVHLKHSATILVHHGRLGPAYDICSKVVMDILRDDGIYGNGGALVVTVITQALREAFTLHLEGIVDDETQAVALAKYLVPCLMIRGAQLSIVRKLEAAHIASIQTNLLSWAVRRAGAFEAGKNKKGRNSALLFFRVLQPLLVAVEAREALRIKAHLEQALALAKLEVSATAPAWEPVRAYERRLNNIMAKAKGKPPLCATILALTHFTIDAGGSSRNRKVGKAAEPTTSDEEGLAHSPDEGEEAAPPPPPQARRPRARPVRRNRRDGSAAPSEPDGGDDSEAQEQEDTRPARARRTDSSPQKTPRRGTPSMAVDEPDVDATPRVNASRKRGREDEEEAAEEKVADDEALSPLSPAPSGDTIPSPPLSQASSTGGGAMRIGRKRARH